MVPAQVEHIEHAERVSALSHGRLAALMIGYGGANLESFLVRSSIVYVYARYDRGRGAVRISSFAAALWSPVTAAVSFAGSVDVGGAEVPGRYAMLVRSVASLLALLLTYL